MSKLRLSLVFGLSFITLAGGYLTISFERQNILDWLTLIGYKPPYAIAAIAVEDEMLPYTKRVFYVNKPQIDSKQVFAKYCPNSSEQAVVLGCYHSGQGGIYILSVHNSMLSGIEQVTAAYETLHAIYQRLGSSGQAKLNAELLNFDRHGLNNASVKQQIAGFKKTEPGQVLNEMTSLFGTEVSNLPPNLNSFYRQYFKNRQVILNLYNNYQTAFTSRQNHVSEDDNRLSTLSAQINSVEQALKAELVGIDAEQTTINQEKASNEINAYNLNVASYNQNVDSYNNLVISLKNLIDQFNALVSSRNSIAFEEQQLLQAITSSQQPISNWWTS